MTKTDWTAEEVLENARILRSRSAGNGSFLEQCSDQLTYLAERIEADESAVSAEDRFEHFVRTSIDNAPEPLRRLGEYLTRVLDEDEWPTAEHMLLGIAAQPPAQPAQEQPGWKVLPNGELVGALIVAEDASKRWNTRATPAQTVDIDRKEAAIELAVKYGGIDGAHHKDWVIDQMVRVLAGDDYAVFVAEAKAGEDGPDTYDWNEGIAP